MDAEVILIPGHAYVGVRAAQNGGEFIYLDTVLTGRANFESAVQTANDGMKRLNAKDVLHIMIPDARTAGVFPMPGPDTESGVKAVLAASRAE
jgi:hypothetical protein